MYIYEKNLAALKEYDSEFYNKICVYQDMRDDNLHVSVSLETSKDGLTILKLVDSNGKNVYLESQYAPEREASKFVEQYSSVNRHSVMFFLGIGNPFIINGMIKKMPETITYMFYEPEVEIFYKALQAYDFSEILKSGRVILLVKGLNGESLENTIAQRITQENYKICILDALPKYKQLYEKDFAYIEKIYRLYITYKMADINTAAHFGQSVVKSGILNLRYVPECIGEEDLKEFFVKSQQTNFPAIVVSAGPSLEKNGMFLNDAKGHSLIIAVDSAIPYLMKNNIMPDVIISTDSHKPIKLFEDERTKEIPIVVHGDSNYQILEKRNGKKVFFVSAREAYYYSVFQKGDKEIYEMPNGGSVATSAFIMAVAWGFKRIILIGQDLALTGNKVHAGDIGVDDYKLKNKLIPLEGYYGDTVYTSEDYNLYRQWFEVNIATLEPDMEVINATEGGAKIDGAIQMPFSEVIKQYCNNSFDYETKLKNLPASFSVEAKKKVVERICESENNLERLKRLLKESISLSGDAVRMLQRGEINISKLRGIKKKIDRLSEKCDAIEEIYYLDCLAAKEYNDLLGDLYAEGNDEIEEPLMIYKKLNYYTSLLEKQIPEVKEYFEVVINDLKNRYPYINGEIME